MGGRRVIAAPASTRAVAVIRENRNCSTPQRHCHACGRCSDYRPLLPLLGWWTYNYSAMAAQWRQLALGTSLGVAAVVAWLLFRTIFPAAILFVISIGFVTHSPCITASGEHGRTCAWLTVESHPQRRDELPRPTIRYLASVCIGIAIIWARQSVWELITTHLSFVAAMVASSAFKHAVMWVAMCALGISWVQRVVSAARTLRAQTLSQ
jgi:hypothetical protein